MTQRRRLSRAQVAATPGREVRPGISARTWWPDDLALWPQESRVGVLPSDPPAQDDVLFRRELMTGTFDNRVRGAVMSVEALREMERVLTERSVAMPRAMVMPPWAMREAERFASNPYYPDDKADALGDVWDRAWRADMERRAVERTGRVLVTWLIGRWRR